jgi:hypothetical protein
MFSRRWELWGYSGFWRRVDSPIDANVSDRHTVSIFNPEDKDTGNYRLVYTAPEPGMTSSASSFYTDYNYHADAN